MAKEKTKSGKSNQIVVRVAQEDREKALKTVLSKIEKDYGKGSLMKLGESVNENVEVIPTGILTLDLALGVGGLPRGRIIEIYGPESSGKTTVALHTIAQAQKQGGQAVFIDAEHALDPNYAAKLGVNINDLYVSQPDCGEQALEITEELVRSGAVDIIVVDSVAALVPRGEINGDMGDSHVGLHARLMSQALRKLTGVIAKSKTVVIFINQLRDKVGVMFGGSETTTGGRALKFYASVRMDIRIADKITDSKGNMIGKNTRAKIVKNKMAPPFQEATFEVIYGEGISREGALIDVALSYDILKKSGSWFSYNDKHIAQGKEKAKDFLKNNTEVYNEIEKLVMEKVKNKVEAKPIDKKKAAADSDDVGTDTFNADNDILDSMDENESLDDLLGLDEI